MHYDVTGMVAEGVTVVSIAMLLLTGFLLLVWNYKNTTSMAAVLVCIPTNSVRQFLFLHTLSSIYCL